MTPIKIISMMYDNISAFKFKLRL